MTGSPPSSTTRPTGNASCSNATRGRSAPRRPWVRAECGARKENGAPGETRTPTSLRITDFESAASTNSATGARGHRRMRALPRAAGAQKSRAGPAATASAQAMMAPGGCAGQPAGRIMTPAGASSSRSTGYPVWRRHGAGRQPAPGCRCRAAVPTAACHGGRTGCPPTRHRTTAQRRPPNRRC